MAATNYLQRRGNVYQFRVRVPHDLVRDYDGRAEIKVSLKTSDVRLARERAAHWAARYLAEFRARRQARAQLYVSPPARVVSSLDQATVQELVSSWTHACLSGDEAFYAEEAPQLDDEAIEQRERELTETLSALRRALARGRTETIRPVVDFLLASSGIDVRVHDPSQYRQLELAMLKAASIVTDARLRRAQGEIVETGDVVGSAAGSQTPARTPGAPSQTSATRCTFDTLIDLWKGQKSGRTAETEGDMSRSIRMLRDYMGDKIEPEAVTRDHVRLFLRKLHDDGLAPATVRKHRGMIRTLFATAIAESMLEKNPADGVRIIEPSIEDPGRADYGLEDIRKILECPIYTRGTRPRGGGGEAAAWLPLMGLYTGARLEELCQLSVEDVAEEAGIPYLIITDQRPNKRVKSKDSRRPVPIHPLLVEAGFLRYVERIRRQGKEWIFPNLHSDCKGKRSGNWSKWWGRYSIHPS